MPSSKFNQRPVPKQRPAICIAPAGSCLPPYDLAAPDTLTAALVAVDLTNPVPYDWRPFTATQTRETPPAYRQTLKFPDGTFQFRIKRQANPDLWTLTFYCTPAGWPLILVVWTDIFVDQAAPFDTRLLTKQYTPGTHYYRARLTA